MKTTPALDEYKARHQKPAHLNTRQKMILHTLFKIKDADISAPKKLPPINANPPKDTQSNSRHNKLPGLRSARENNTSPNLYYQVGKHTVSESNIMMNSARKISNSSLLNTENSLQLLSITRSETKLPPIMDKTLDLQNDEVLSSLIKKEPTETVTPEPKETMVMDVFVENECMKIIKEKLEEYELQYPQSRIFQEDVDSLNALELKNGYFIGECQFDSQKWGYGVMFYNNRNVYDGMWQEDNKFGFGREAFNNGDLYEGEFKKGKPYGKGLFKWTNGEMYDGEWMNGFKEGYGVWKNDQGDFYEGEWKAGKAHGKGHQKWGNGDEYKGEFKESLKHGHGEEKFANGDHFVGTFSKGRPMGYGEYSWSNGSLYKGQFVNGLREGQGYYQNSKDEKFVGMFKKDKKNGFGEFRWASGNLYKGNYLNDLRDGYGEVTWSDGSFYKGEWKQGLQHGIGELYIPGQSHIRGVFQDNKLLREDVPLWREAKKNRQKEEKNKHSSSITEERTKKSPQLPRGNRFTKDKISPHLLSEPSESN